MDKDTGVEKQKDTQGTASPLVWLPCKVGQLGGVGGGTACVSVARSREALNNVLRNWDFAYVSNSGHPLFVNRGGAYSD